MLVIVSTPEKDIYHFCFRLTRKVCTAEFRQVSRHNIPLSQENVISVGGRRWDYVAITT